MQRLQRAGRPATATGPVALESCRGRGYDGGYDTLVATPGDGPSSMGKRQADVSEIWFVGMRKVDRSAHIVAGAFGADEFWPTAQRAPISNPG
jgi:hypothetical protein